MGYGEFGGNGSVQWEVNVNDVHGIPTSVGKSPKGFLQAGVDPSKGPPQSPGDNFTISIKAPSGEPANAFKARLCSTGITVVGNRVIITIPIEQGNKDQVRVEW